MGGKTGANEITSAGGGEGGRGTAAAKIRSNGLAGDGGGSSNGSIRKGRNGDGGGLCSMGESKGDLNGGDGGGNDCGDGDGEGGEGSATGAAGGDRDGTRVSGSGNCKRCRRWVSAGAPPRPLAPRTPVRGCRIRSGSSTRSATGFELLWVVRLEPEATDETRRVGRRDTMGLMADENSKSGGLQM